MKQPIDPRLAKFQAHKAMKKRDAIRNKDAAAKVASIMESNSNLSATQAMQIAKRSVELNGQ